MSKFTYNFIVNNLAQGSAPEPCTALPFDTLVLCAMEYQPSSKEFPGLSQVIHVPLNDDGSRMTGNEMRYALKAGLEVARQLKQGRRILVTCWKGRNRSGLVSALALENLGVKYKDAVKAVRRARTFALTNKDFIGLLKLNQQHLDQTQLGPVRQHL